MASPFGAFPEAPSPLPAELQAEYDTIAHQLAEFQEQTEDVELRLRREALTPAALIAEADRDPLDVVLRRTRALLDDLQGMAHAPDLTAEAGALARLLGESQAVAQGDGKRLELFEKACTLRRRIAFANPLLDFDEILFLKHHRARYEHMVDQYFGFHGIPGGGVYVLKNAFSESPVVRDVLKDSTVEAGRLAGRSLDGGSFISLELDFAGREILFAWTEAQVPVNPTDRTLLQDLWKPESTYHIFRARIDGSSLQQLTDGCWNDFDPCWLPGGRICFISERRGGFLRCGVRPDPTYTLHSMRGDGSDIIALSYHETHEWHPSVDHDGMIVYTRWDYVDRDSDIAHHLWLTYPDGRDPRSFHGNYPNVRESRPWMELSIRAIPGSHKYVAVAAPHHGQNYGSLVLIDLHKADDRAMAQLARITPETAFPESEVAPGVPGKLHGGKNIRKAEVYGTPWPLSERYYLCVYDRGQKNYGLYLVDAFGNRELLYRDPEIACLDPIPLRPRPKPPIIPPYTQHAAEDREGEPAQTGNIAVMNVYESDFTWPENTAISALRIIQMFPKTTPASTEPNIGVGAQSLTRGVLGTVPVEKDGSAYFEAPAGVPIYFQALDAQGRAVQSMRSITYLHPGETLSCLGCHEHKQRTNGPLANQTPLAMQRPPSKLAGDVEGSYPVLYPQLVQPVLEKHCLTCHRQEEKAPSLESKMAGKWGWSESYQTLGAMAWSKHGGNGALGKNETSYSVAGDVGARASRLLKHLEQGHHDVKLTEDELYRFTLWLDCNSVFYGAYHDTEKQARGETVMPTLF